MEPVGLPAAAGMPPHVAQVPMAMTAAALGAITASRAAVGNGRASLPSITRSPIAEKYPLVSAAMRSSAMEPS